VIISKYGKSYDTSDGSEQHFEDSTRRAQSVAQAANQRWDDDGGPVNDLLRGAFALGRTLPSKPPWSVLSLRDLTEAMRRGRRYDDPARLQQESERTERERIRANEIHNDNVAADVRAKRDRYRNDWEHT
jgi:hypothetical protein